MPSMAEMTTVGAASARSTTRVSASTSAWRPVNVDKSGGNWPTSAEPPATPGRLCTRTYAAPPLPASANAYPRTRPARASKYRCSAILAVAFAACR